MACVSAAFCPGHRTGIGFVKLHVQQSLPSSRIFRIHLNEKQRFSMTTTPAKGGQADAHSARAPQLGSKMILIAFTFLTFD
jgi:hypothetical protein